MWMVPSPDLVVARPHARARLQLHQVLARKARRNGGPCITTGFLKLDNSIP